MRSNQKVMDAVIRTYSQLYNESIAVDGRTYEFGYLSALYKEFNHGYPATQSRSEYEFPYLYFYIDNDKYRSIIKLNTKRKRKLFRNAVWQTVSLGVSPNSSYHSFSIYRRAFVYIAKEYPELLRMSSPTGKTYEKILERVKHIFTGKMAMVIFDNAQLATFIFLRNILTSKDNCIIFANMKEYIVRYIDEAGKTVEKTFTGENAKNEAREYARTLKKANQIEIEETEK